jgi:predicted Zn-dependent protease
MRRAIAYTAFACLMLLGTACGADTIFGEKTNPQAEIELGLAASKYYEQQEGLSTNKEAQARVERIGQALVAHLDKKMYPYRFKVLSPNIINAFCLPGGIHLHLPGASKRAPG